MSKLLLFLSFLALVFVLTGSLLMPQELMFWFTSTAPTYQFLRLILATVLLIQLVTRPPRNVYFRMIAGTIGIATGVFVVQQTYLYQLQLLDGLSLSAAAVAIMVTALEKRLELPILPPAVQQMPR